MKKQLLWSLADKLKMPQTQREIHNLTVQKPRTHFVMYLQRINEKDATIPVAGDLELVSPLEPPLHLLGS